MGSVRIGLGRLRGSEEFLMPKIVDLTGQQFGGWHCDKLISARPRRYQCTCTCGNKKIKSAGQLNSGKTRSCGSKQCRKLNQITGKHFGRELTDLTGKKFGSLVVVKRDPYTGSIVRWICLCSCGNKESVIGSRLRCNKKKACHVCLIKNKTCEWKEKICLCGVKFTDKRSASEEPQKYCGKKCSLKYSGFQKKNLVSYACKFCGKVKKTLPSKSVNECCSLRCAMKLRNSRFNEKNIDVEGVFLSIADIMEISGLQRCSVVLNISKGVSGKDLLRRRRRQ